MSALDGVKATALNPKRVTAYCQANAASIYTQPLTIKQTNLQRKVHDATARWRVVRYLQFSMEDAPVGAIDGVLRGWPPGGSLNHVWQGISGVD